MRRVHAPVRRAAVVHLRDPQLITGGACDVSEDWTRAWNDRKHRLGFRLFGNAIGADPSPVLTALSDNVRTITDLTTPNGSRRGLAPLAASRRECIRVRDVLSSADPDDIVHRST